MTGRADRVLVLSSRPLSSRSSGYDIRVVNLCAATPGERHLVVVPLEPDPDEPTTLDHDDVFATVGSLEPFPAGTRSWRRLLRATDDHYLGLSAPDWFAGATARLTELVRRHDIGRVVAFGTDVAELASALEGLDTVVDVCDSRSLVHRRRVGAEPVPGALARVRSRVDLRRVEATEGGLARRFRAVVTISDTDTQRVRELSRGASNLHTVANGVDDSLLAPLPEPATARTVAFWGKLDFEPNQDALRWYLEEIHRPHLRDAGVTLQVVGPSAPPWLLAEAEQDPSVHLAGFVPDLRDALIAHPVMVNPMRLGTGLKNKVLEAFGLGLVVVSTARGVEALPQLRDGVHVALADDADGFAAATLALLDDPARRTRIRLEARELLETHYRWETVGRRWQQVLDGG